MAQTELDETFNDALRYQKGIDVPVDLSRARELYRIAAEQGHSRSCVNLAYLLETGKGGLPSIPDAILFLRKAAEAGDSLAKANLGRLLLEYEEREAGLEWLEQAAIERNQDAAIRLASERLSDPALASDALSLLTELAPANGLAAACLASAYWFGVAVPQDRSRAVELYRASAQLEHPDGQLALALILLQRYDEDSDPSTEQVSEALQLIERAAESGLFAACAELGELLAVGRYGVPRDPARAIPLLRHAANQHDPRPKGLLAWLSYHGDAPMISPEECFRLCRAAAQEADMAAHRLIAMMYRDGHGTRVNRRKARYHIEKAIALGYDDARPSLSRYPNPPITRALVWLQRKLEASA